MSICFNDNSNDQDLVELLRVRPSKPILSWDRARTWALLLPALATSAVLHASTIGVSANGTCYAGSCPPTALAVNTTETLPIDFTITLADGDRYLINGTFGGSRSGNVSFSTNHEFQVTYEGNANGGPSLADTVTVEADYAFATTPGSSTVSHRTLLGAFGPTIASTSSASSCVNGNLGCLGPANPPHSFSLSTSFTLHATGNEFIYDPDFVGNFGAGSAVGSYIVWGKTAPIPPPVSSTPEPASVGLIGAGMVGAAIAMRYSRRGK